MAGLHARHSWHAVPTMLLSLVFALAGISETAAQPAVLQYTDCFSGSNTTQKLNISTVYGQLLTEPHATWLNLTLIGSTPDTILEASNGSDPVASKSTQCV